MAFTPPLPPLAFWSDEVTMESLSLVALCLVVVLIDQKISTIKIEDQVMMTEGHSFCCNDCDLLSTRMIHYIVFNLLFEKLPI